MALRVSRTARRRYGLEDLLPTAGRLPASDLAILRRIAARINQARFLDETAHRLTGGELLAVSAMEDRLVESLARARGRRGALDWQAMLSSLARRAATGRVDELLGRWAAEFEELGESRDGAQRLRELVTLWLLEDNAVTQGIVSLLAEGAPRLAELWEGPARSFGQRWMRALRRRARIASPAGGTLADQVRNLAARTSESSGEPAALGAEAQPAFAASELLTAADALAEEGRPGHAPPDEVPTAVPAGPATDWQPPWRPVGRYSAESPWMAEVVLVAKQVHVWLDQLSRRAGKTLRRLDEVPDDELERLARWGFNTLWLVGIWQRSRASRWIKQLGGNAEAAASAYAVAEYRVAEELGGEAARDILRRQAAERGIRLAADMVPNHMGIDSAWVIEHPKRFLSRADSPFPSYSFSGPDLSPDPAVGLYLEDHYYDRTDAAVVFQRLDRDAGEARYLYHGNDGTGLPWNDTAQLDYLQSDVRAAVLETIVQVARQFPVLRFDAAMTLARRHYQRLWFPLPGDGGAIPSRAGHGVAAETFDRWFPAEFWREVVERVTAEVPEALLIAEAFWLMEAYFARELGLHRVYNSAFMNHLRARRPGALRRHLAELLLLDPQLLAHQVNYLSNPDEAPARELYAPDEHYLAVCTLLATLPGLPLFAHGQVEGLRERYGMEYRRAYLDEEADENLIAAHERRIAPLLARRRLFAGVKDFRLYEPRSERRRAEEILAFSNGLAEDLHVIAGNLGSVPWRGAIDQSLPSRTAAGSAVATGRLVDMLPRAEQGLARLTARDLVTGERLSWSVPGRSGLVLELAPWQTRVLADFAWVPAPPGSVETAPRPPWWRRLLAWLRRRWESSWGRT